MQALKRTCRPIQNSIMLAAEQVASREWSDLPNELLSLIAERAWLLDLKSFSHVCKAWNSAYSAVLPQILATELNQGPWFLLYDEKDSECRLISGSGKKLTMSLPELNGTTCLASHNGWLLLFQQGCGSMFFLHIFCLQRIDLPEFPDSELTDHVAAVSCPPTSKDCVVCVISRSSDAELEAKVLHLGQDQAWIGTKCSHPRADTDTIKCGVYLTEMRIFCFLDIVNRTTITISTENLSPKWRVYFLNVKPSGGPKHFLLARDEYLKNMKQKLGLTEDVSFSTCGTITPSRGGMAPTFNFNESINAHADQSKNRHFKGVWIQPRFSADAEAQNIQKF